MGALLRRCGGMCIPEALPSQEWSWYQIMHLWPRGFESAW